MKTIAALSLAAALTLLPSLSQAQNSGAPPQGSPDSAQQGNTGPDQEKGSTGWGGGSKVQGSQGHPIDPMTGQAVQVHDEAEAKDQPPLASGEDLKGPAVQLAPSQTPE